LGIILHYKFNSVLFIILCLIFLYSGLLLFYTVFLHLYQYFYPDALFFFSEFCSLKRIEISSKLHNIFWYVSSLLPSQFEDTGLQIVDSIHSYYREKGEKEETLHSFGKSLGHIARLQEHKKVGEAYFPLDFSTALSIPCLLWRKKHRRVFGRVLRVRSTSF